MGGEVGGGVAVMEPEATPFHSSLPLLSSVVEEEAQGLDTASPEVSRRTRSGCRQPHQEVAALQAARSGGHHARERRGSHRHIGEKQK
ncbi:hypothetical protein E2562_021569 [Oryza meyeriana var. granulata]|uniref:Uncharacterized protein n=1 Tax=Oryza meyeriana var. granulata TaxID=110450 RepID=A0A6G1EXR4_9ORYZ|nr:hypothetical protein E2562_021569 [Oryza meyeriana var. granulata]